ELIRDLRKGWDPHWKDRGKKTADFGELRGLKTMPGVLLEMAFHDYAKDARALTSPVFRQLTARAVYKGIVRFFAKKNRQTPIFLPEPPTHLLAQNQKVGTVHLSWKAPVSGGVYGDRASEYRVYQSRTGKGFARGIYCRGTSVTIKDLEPGQTYFFQITAVNEGGESLPSPVIAVRLSQKNNQDKYLIVDGFDRLDRSMAALEQEYKPYYAPLGPVRRLRLEKMNNYDYAIPHARALAACEVAFDGATNETVRAGRVSLQQYTGVDWFLGRESVADQTLDDQEQAILRKYLDNGGHLLISGSELAFDLDHKGNGRSFFRNYLKAAYLGDDAQTDRFRSPRGGALAGVQGDFVSETYHAYPVYSPDYIRSINGGINGLSYAGGKTAGVVYRGHYALAHFAFPLEMIAEETVRIELFRKSLAYFASKRKTKLKDANNSQVLTKVPDVFDDEIELDLRRIPEGRAVFRLFDKRGEEVYYRYWSHRGFREKTLTIGGIPAAMYEYELELLGQKQRGFVLKQE
ncbi:MAG: fibronectin type III domain-containing protein, partial [Bacteroidota bacterium]